MNAERRVAYLRAMGLEIWVSRTGSVTPPAGLVSSDAEKASAENDPVSFSSASSCFVAPGSGDTLLMCGGPGEAATAVARDIARSLRIEPVWGWPLSPGSSEAPSLEQVIRDRLFTRLILFGMELAGSSGEAAPAIIGTAEALTVSSLPELARSGTARKALWQSLSARQWMADRARTISADRSGAIEG